MKFIDRLERKLGRYALENLSLMLIICYGFGYAISFVNNSFLSYLTLNPYLILHGQIWRLVSWILIPPSRFGVFTIIMLYFYYSIGKALEHTWGPFKFDLYIISGMLFTILGSFLLLGYQCLMIQQQGFALNSQILDTYFGSAVAQQAFTMFSTYYINMSIFLAFALTFPDMVVYLFFVIPLKVKWLGVFDIVLLAFSFFTSSVAGKIVIAASLLNVIIFFLLTRGRFGMPRKTVKRKVVFRTVSGDGPKKMRSAGITRHKCAICGRTEQDSELEFRFCSKCNGNYEYCQNHLFTHEHIR